MHGGVHLKDAKGSVENAHALFQSIEHLTRNAQDVQEGFPSPSFSFRIPEGRGKGKKEKVVKSLIVVVSVHHGNTRRVAQAMGEVLESQIREPEELAPEDLAAFDLVGFGSGIYFGRFHRRLIAFVERLPHGQGQKAFVFSTSGLGRASANRPLEELLRQKGFAVLGSFTCKGYDTFGVLRVFGGINRGKPGEKELGKARKFARFLRILVAGGGENHA